MFSTKDFSLLLVSSRKRSDGAVYGKDAMRGTVEDRTTENLQGISRSQNRRSTSSRTILE